MNRPLNIVISADNDVIYWDCEGSVSRYYKDTNKIQKFELLMKTVVHNRLFQKALKRKFSKEQQDEFMNMINNQTSIEITKKATEEEIKEHDKSLWNKVKSKFKKTTHK